MKGKLGSSGSDIARGGKNKMMGIGLTAKAAGFKTGGKIGVGKISGGMAKAISGKFARGGKMTPSSPLSGATVKELPFAKNTQPAQDAGGKGKDMG